MPDFGAVDGEADGLRQVLSILPPGAVLRPFVIVLHGPPGAGKSTLAAEVARRYAREAWGPSSSGPLPVHWLSLGGASVDARGILLRLLAECGAPRRDVIRAALAPDRRFDRQLRQQCKQFVGERVVVLDDVSPAVARPVLKVLRDCSRLRVIVTSRHEHGWRDVDLQRSVRPPAQERDSEEPESRLRHSLDQLSTQERILLEFLVSRRSRAPFTTLTIRPSNRRDAMAGLLRLGLVRRVHESEDLFVLSERVRGTVLSHPFVLVTTPKDVTLELARAAVQPLEESAGLLHGLRFMEAEGLVPSLPRELVPHIDEFMQLLAETRRLRERHLEKRLISALATILAFLGDAHRLVALLRRSPKNRAVRRALCALAREVGLPDVAQSLIHGDTSADADFERAANHHATGHLDSALDALGEPFETEDIHTAWALLIRGAVLCDQGHVLEAERHLRFSVDLHRAFDCRRGSGWALLHLARVSLLQGHDHEAAHRLRQAAEAAEALGDVRAQNWVETEWLRLRAQRRDNPAAPDRDRLVLAAHLVREDVRGMGWAHLWMGRACEGAGEYANAEAEWGEALKWFTECQDALGLAWTRHRQALAFEADRAHNAHWLDTYWSFTELGCAYGRAWTALEIAARAPGRALSQSYLAVAWSVFESLNDTNGRSWAEAVSIARADVRTASANHPNTSEDVRQFLANHEAGEPTPIPPHARDLILIDGQSDTSAGCRVRITLLDESPTADTTARLLLRVAPEPGHPWASDPRATPWLTATALPLTHATLEPASALLRPSEQEEHGAEFDFVPHRTGTHRLRFTIALERTGTVLQQVETEIDILDTDHQGSHAAPHAVTPRGR
ncbi:AAA family ATPase [Streptomyces sp. NBRC 14336]|uniref:AAA family ATPase n=1 Tax=Streptomyces sp. NBRC 14336 TaxID=3030992 RepID=UPI0025534398|nr:AAA family ATPase [Streptomyces sp. NBRC 14336]